MSIRFRPAIFGITCLGFIGLCAPISSAQVARTELHAIPTLTLSDRQTLPLRMHSAIASVASA